MWQKWHDPLAAMVKKAAKNQNFHQEDDEDDEYRLAIKSFNDNDNDDDDDDDDDDDESPYDSGEQKGNTGPCVIGPMGVIPMHESNIPSKMYNFWMGDTNFDLTNDIAKKIESCTGVESLDVYSRYRFRIAIGRAFNQRDVKTGIEKIIDETCPNKPPEKQSPPPNSSRIISRPIE